MALAEILLNIKGLIALVFLMFIHIFANQAKILGWVWHGRFLSFAGGLSFAYVFVDLLPTLEVGQPIIKETLDPIFPFLNKHAYVIALIGVLFTYRLEQPSLKYPKMDFWLSIAGYQIFNLFVGVSLVDSDSPEIQPLILFALALGMHYFVHDHNLSYRFPYLYQKYGRFILTMALAFGYIIGLVIHIPDAAVAILVAFLAGGVLLNTLHYELPKQEPGEYSYFILGSVLYTAIILSIGNA